MSEPGAGDATGRLAEAVAAQPGGVSGSWVAGSREDAEPGGEPHAVPAPGMAAGPPPGDSAPEPAGPGAVDRPDDAAARSREVAASARYPAGGRHASPSSPRAGLRAGPRAAVVEQVAASREATRRRAVLRLTRLDPWSVTKLALVFSVCLAIVWVVAVAALYLALSGLGVFHAVDKAVSGLLTSGSVVPSLKVTVLVAAVVGAVNAVLFTLLATIAAVLFNTTSYLTGGVEVTLSDRG